MTSAAQPEAPMASSGAGARPDVSRGWIARYGLMYLGQNIAWSAPSMLLLANQILIWFPETKETMLGWLMFAGGCVALLAAPTAGILSDRTRTRFGRRTPWVVGGMLGAACSLLAAALAGLAGPEDAGIGFTILVIAWMAFQGALALAVTPTQAIAPDRVPQHQFGMVSGIMGMTYTLGVVLGTGVATALPSLPAYLVTIAILLLAPMPFLLRHREEPSNRPNPGAASEAGEALEAMSRHGLRGVLPSVRRHTDFWWMLATRTLLTLAQAIALFYLLYYLRDRIGHADPDTGVLILTGVFAVCVIATAVGSGWASDRAGRRKPFVATAALGVGASCVMMALAGSFPIVVGAAVVLGLSWGVYQAIDQALVNQVLPEPERRATHMGVMNLGVQVPNTLAPLVAALAVTQLGGYAGLYVLAAAMSMLGGLLVLRIHGSR